MLRIIYIWFFNSENPEDFNEKVLERWPKSLFGISKDFECRGPDKYYKMYLLRKWVRIKNDEGKCQTIKKRLMLIYANSLRNLSNSSLAISFLQEKVQTKKNLIKWRIWINCFIQKIKNNVQNSYNLHLLISCPISDHAPLIIKTRHYGIPPS